VTVYAFILRHIISAGMISRANIKLVNEKKGYFRLEQAKGSHPLTEYKLIINNPSALGFSATEGSIAENRINDIVLAMNLTLEEAALSRRGSTLSKPTISSTNERNKENIKEVTRGKQQLDESVIISEDVKVLVQREQQLDESIILTNLQLVGKVDWYVEDHQQNTTRHNLAKALRHYEGAFNQIENEEIFKDIFNAVEEAVNWDKNITGKGLDSKLSAVANIPANKAEQWRCMYDRLKHPDYKKQLAEYIQAKSKIPDELVPLRRAANTVFSNRLKKI
jgi:hypothetical protein